MSGTVTVSSQSDFNKAIENIDQQTLAGSYTIDLTSSIIESPGTPAGLYAIDLLAGVTLSIEGGGNILNGGGTDGGIAVIGGKVSITDLTIEDTVAQGGDGDNSGGGGAGLGGGLFVGPGAAVTISQVMFSNDAAKGGAGGTGGGGGAGGNASLFYVPLTSTAPDGAAGSAGQNAPTPLTNGGGGAPGSIGLSGGYGADGGQGGDGGKGGDGAAGTAGSSYSGGPGGDGGTGAPGGPGGPGGKGGDGGGGGDGGDGGDGTTPPPNYPHHGGSANDGANGGNAATGGAGGYGGGGGAGGDGGGGGKGGDAPLANRAVAGKPGGTGGAGAAGGTGGAGGFGAGGGGGGKGGDGGDGGNGGQGGPGGATMARTGGTSGVGGQLPLVSAKSSESIQVVLRAGASYPPGSGGAGGNGGAGGSGGHGGVGGFGGGGGGGGPGGDGGQAGQPGPGGTPGSSSYPTAAPGRDGRDGQSGGGGLGAGGGFGGGGGAGASSGGLQGAGGGGLGAGGDIFVANGGALLVEGGYMAGSASGGAAGGSGAGVGAGYGDSVFLQGDQSITLAASSASPLYVYQDISDEAAHGGTGHGSVVVSGTNSVVFDAANDYTGGTTLEGDLVLMVGSAAGSGDIDFVGDHAVLTFGRTIAPNNPITGFSTGDTLFIYGIDTTTLTYANGMLALTGNDDGPVSLNLNVAGDYATPDFSYNSVVSGTETYTIISVDTPPPPTTFSFNGGVAPFADPTAWTTNLGGTGTPTAGATALFAAGGTMTGSGTVAVMGVSSEIAFAGSFATGLLNDEAGVLTLQSGILQAGTALVAGATTGDIDVAGAATLDITGSLTLGNLGSGTLAIMQGGTASISDGVFIGAAFGGSGALLLDGDGDAGQTAMLTLAGPLRLGQDGDGSLSLVNASSLTTRGVIIADAAQSRASALLEATPNTAYTNGYAPVWSVGGNLIVGDAGDGSIDLQGINAPVLLSFPTLATTGIVVLGELAGSSGEINVATAQFNPSGGLVVGDAGEGTLTVSAESYVEAESGEVTIGARTGGHGVVDLTGGGIGNNKYLTVGGAGSGTLAMSERATAFDDNVTIGAAAGGYGSIDLNQAGLGVEGNLVVGDAGTGTLTTEDSYPGVSASAGISATNVVIGATLGAYGSLAINDSGLEVIGRGGLIIGQAGSGSLSVGGGGQVIDDAITEGVTLGQTGFGQLSLDGGSALVAGIFGAKALIDGAAGQGVVSLTNDSSASFGGFDALGALAGGSGRLTIASASTVGCTTELDIGYAAGASGIASVTGAGSQLDVAGIFNIGDGGSGTLAIGAGATVSVANSGSIGYFALAEAANSFGTLSVDGLDSTLSIGSDLSVAVDGQARVSVTNGATLVDAGGLFSGFAAGAAANISVLSNGSMLVGGDLFLADTAGASASLAIGAGGVVSAPALFVGGAVGGPGGTGSVTLGAGGTLVATAATVYAAGVITLAGGTLLTDPLTIEAGGAAGGSGLITGTISGAGSLFSSLGGTLTLDDAVNAGVDVADHGTVALADLGGFLGTLTGLAAGSQIHLIALDLGGSIGNVASLSIGSPHQLTIDLVGGGTYGVSLDPDVAFSSANFLLAADPGGGTDIFYEQISCYVAGTLILTDRGVVAIERLRLGDRLATYGGGSRPVMWLGSRAMAPGAHASSARISPVRVQAHAFGRSLPTRDLLLSPDHAVFVASQLVPIRHLINNTTISQHSCESVTYWHVELDRHDVIFAEGLPCESYLDTGNRDVFGQAGGVFALHSQGASAARVWAARGYAPLLQSGPALAAIRADLDTQARGLGHANARLQDFVLWQTGQVAVPIAACVDGVRLLSPSGFAPGDRRSLGALVAGVQVDGQPLDPRGYGVGFHPPETHAGRSVRWTDGEALVSLDKADRPRLLRIDVAALFKPAEFALPACLVA